jgi:hypothetical protein
MLNILRKTLKACSPRSACASFSISPAMSGPLHVLHLLAAQQRDDVAVDDA